MVINWHWESFPQMLLKTKNHRYLDVDYMLKSSILLSKAFVSKTLTLNGEKNQN